MPRRIVRVISLPQLAYPFDDIRRFSHHDHILNPAVGGSGSILEEPDVFISRIRSRVVVVLELVAVMAEIDVVIVPQQAKRKLIDVTTMPCNAIDPVLNLTHSDRCAG